MRTTLLFLLTIFCGIICCFPQNSFAQESLPMVRLVYFLPSDRIPQQDVDTRMDAMIKDVQQFFADEMERHGFGRKTFQFETDMTGKAIVHHVIGERTEEYYRQSLDVWQEIGNQIDTSKHVYVAALDVEGGFCGYGSPHGDATGQVLISAGNDCLDPSTTAHELAQPLGWLMLGLLPTSCPPFIQGIKGICLYV